MTRILAIHNAYQQYGGEDAVFAAEVSMLRGAGHEVVEHTVSNDRIDGPLARVATSLLAPYNPVSRAELAAVLARVAPDIAHVHNFFPLLSPSVFDACAAAGVPAVWTVHNFRIACANGFLFRDGAPCEDCLGRAPWPAVRHRCYRGSLPGSIVVAGSIALHKARGTWQHKVARFIALTAFSKTKLVAAGVPPELIAVKPNFLADSGVGDAAAPVRRGMLFVGRLSEEKGVRALIEAWRTIDVPLSVIGDGPLMGDIRRSAPPHVALLGHRRRDEVIAAMRAAQAVVIPSLWYENFPVTAVEALATGTPVIASRLGALPEIIGDGVEGALFEVGNAADLAHTASRLLDQPGMLAAMGTAARTRYEKDYGERLNLSLLESIYASCLVSARRSLSP